MGLDMTKCNGYCGKCLKWSVHYGIRDCGEDDGKNESLALKTCEDEKKKYP
jgi:hypothetical protein